MLGCGSLCVTPPQMDKAVSDLVGGDSQSAICVSRSMATLRGKLAKDKHFKSTFKKTTCLRMANITLTSNH